MLVLTRAVAAGHGVAVLPRRSVADPGGADLGGVDVRPLTDPARARRLLAVARPGAAARPPVAAVLDALVAAAG